MMFELDVQSGKPVYEQLMDKLKELMINEVLQEHDQLPSIRILAQELTIKGISWHLLDPSKIH
jgi:GntR family transcriptional regulator